jgi:hypothetical protein
MKCVPGTAGYTLKDQGHSGVPELKSPVIPIEIVRGFPQSLHASAGHFHTNPF